MSDIVEKLRAPAYWFSGSDEGHEGENSAPLDAASTIERLRVELTRINMENDRLTRTNRAKREHRNKLLHEITRLRAALRAIREMTAPKTTTAVDPVHIPAIYIIARAALGGENDQ